MFHLYAPWRCQKTFCFLTFSGGVEMEHWTKNGLTIWEKNSILWCELSFIGQFSALDSLDDPRFQQHKWVIGVYLRKRGWGFWFRLKRWLGAGSIWLHTMIETFIFFHWLFCNIYVINFEQVEFGRKERLIYSNKENYAVVLWCSNKLQHS